MMYQNKYILGLDIGISSVGWGLLLLDDDDKPYRILDVGSRVFSPGETESGDSKARERREKRGSKRVSRRREFRVDRVRYLLYQNGFLTGEVRSSLVSEVNLELTNLYERMIRVYYKNHVTNPYQLKVEALDRKLTREELCIILVHYAKRRGYRSNREESANENESGKVKKAIEENQKAMEKYSYRTVSEMYVKDDRFSTKIKNSPDNYQVCVTREMFLKEIQLVLDTQIKYGVIDEAFKNNYLDIWGGQRHYSMGPGYYYVYEDGNRVKKQSPYGGNLIEKMVGKCVYDGEPRAPKYAPSSEVFVALTKLINLRYKSDEVLDYTPLTKDQIAEVLAISKKKKEITYQDVVKVLNQHHVKFKDLQMSKQNYAKVILDFRKKCGYDEKQKIEISSLSEDERNLFDLCYDEKLFTQKLFELKGYHLLKKAIVKSFGKDTWEEIKDNYDALDELALYCTNYKLNEEIHNAICEASFVHDKYADEMFIESLPNLKDHLMLSTSLIRKLIPLMKDGKRYDQAMEELHFSNKSLLNCEKRDLLVPICMNENITNQRVIRSMTQARKIINSIIKKYGTPKIINIETARELAKSMKERREIDRNQREKREQNENIKKQLVELGLFEDVDCISSNDLLKYKLWKEQNEFCPYSLTKISIEELFSPNIVQVDHILPYSRTFNDNYLNKTLVFTSKNQEKRDNTPYEWFGKTEKWDSFETYISHLNIPQAKKDNYLLRNLDDKVAEEMRDQNLNDTKYISKELASLIRAYLNVEKVNVYQGAITAKLRGRWGFNRLTHSCISSSYLMPEDMKVGITKDRDNHLHHAMDALVIAAVTPSLQQKVILYERFSRYIDGELKQKLERGEFLEVDGVTINTETGEAITTHLREYLQEQLSKENIYFSKKGVARLKFPMPYDCFKEEAILRVYEQDREILRESLRRFPTYSYQEIERISPLTPSIAKVKATGAMHKETYYGIREIDGERYKTSRVSLTKLKRKDLDSIPDKNGGSKDIYEAILAWFGDYNNGMDAYKAHGQSYPINPNDIERKEIRKIKIYEKYNDTGHMIDGKNVDSGRIYRIDVFRSKDRKDDKFYFVAYDNFDIAKIKRFQKVGDDFEVNLDYARGKSNLERYSNLAEKYDLFLVLGKHDLVRITLKNGREAIAYVSGFSDGRIEFKSKLGDGYDFVGETKLYDTKEDKPDRYLITVSQIVSIEKLSISILGEIHGV